MTGEERIWQIVERYKTWQSGQRGLMADYSHAFQTEISEIIAQLQQDWPLSGYKLSAASSKDQWKVILKSLFKPASSSTPDIAGGHAADVRLIFVVEFNSHLNQLRPLITILKKRNISYAVFFLSKDLYENKGAEFGHAFIIRANGNLKIRLQYIFLNFRAVCSLLYRFGKTVNQGIFLRALAFLNAKRLYIWLALRREFSAWLDQMPVHAPVVFFKAEGSLTRGLMQICRQNNRRIFAVQHGWISKEIKYHALLPDAYLVWSAFFADTLNASGAGCPAKICGCPAYDQVFEVAAQQRSQSAEPLTLLFLPNSGLSQTPFSEVNWAIECCLLYLQQHPTTRLIVKPHPGDHTRRIEAIIRNNTQPDQIECLENNAPIPYDACHIVVTMNSTVGLEAAIYQKPLVILLSEEKYLLTPEYLQTGYARWVQDQEELEKTILDMRMHYPRYQEKCRQFVNTQLAFPGKAAEKIVESLLC